MAYETFKLLVKNSIWLKIQKIKKNHKNNKKNISKTRNYFIKYSLK